MSEPKRNSGVKVALKAAGGALVVVLLAVLLFEGFVEETPSTAENPPIAQPATPVVSPPPGAEETEVENGAVVARVTGRVERSVAGGDWAEVRQGEKLQANDAIRTGANSRAQLEVDNKSRITVAQSSEVGIREVRKAAHTFKLVRGQLAVDYQPDGTRTLRIEGEGGDAVAQSEGAKFSILSSGGTLAVATETGAVNLEASGTSVAIRAGEQSVARPGSAPSIAAPIPVKLLLKLATTGTEGCPTVRGVAEAGTEVLVDGRAVPLDAKGAFLVKGPTDGRKQLTVVTRHVTGKLEEKVVACRTAPNRADVSIRWKQQK